MNRRLEQVGYRPLSLEPNLQRGLIPIDYDDGDLERRVAAGLARLADVAYERAAQTAQYQGLQDTRRDVLAQQGTPATIEGGDVTGTASINGQAGHIAGAQGYQPPKGIRVTVPPTQIASAIDRAAKTYGEDAGTLRDIAFLESTYDPNARSDKSDAEGLFQFRKGTARDYGLRDPFNADQSADAAARLLRDNRSALRNTLGRDPSAGELYLAHQQGRQGALNLLARPDAKAIDVVGRDAVINNGGTADMTAGQFAKLWTGKLDTASIRKSQRRDADLPIITASANETGRRYDPDLKGIQPAVIDRFKELQNAWGASIPIASGYRDKQRNDAAQGAKHSQHLDGNAIDLDVREMPLEQRKALIRTASAMGFEGIGVYENSIHIDMGERRSWGPNFHNDSIPSWAKDAVAEHLAGKATSTQADDYGRLPDNADGPVNITPVRTPLKITPGKPSTWRPTGQNTIYGRAYDIEGTRTWLQLAKQGIVEEQAQLYDLYKDDPATLKQAFDQLLEQHRRDGTYFPEVAPEYEFEFKSRAFNLTRQAQSEQEVRQKQQDQVDFLGRISDFEDRKAQLLSGLDPKDPQASALLQDAQRTIDSHYDSAGARGIMTPAEVAKAKADSKSAMVVPFYLKQAQGLKTDELEKLHANMKAAWDTGKLTGVTARDWADIDQGLQSAAATRRTNDDKADSDLAARGDDIAARILRGETVAPSDLARMRTDAKTAPHGEDILASTDARVRLANALRTQPIGKVEGNLDAILKGDRDKASAADITYAREKIAKERTDLAVDPLGVAERYGIIPPAPPIAIDGLADPAKLRDALAYRKGAAIAAASHFGVPVKYFRPGEADQITAAAMQNPDAMVAFTLNVTTAFGKETPAAMREISESGPVMAHAVGTSIATGDASLARDVAQISVMKAKKEFSLKMPEAGQLAIKASTYLEGALFAQPKMQNAAMQTANLLFEKMASEQGFDPADVKTPGSTAEAAYFKALDRALGGQVLAGEETGGIGFVNDRAIIVPALMPKDRVENLVAGITERQLTQLPPIGTINKVPITADQIRDGYLVSVGDGQYRVSLNDPQGDSPDYIVAPDGKPWVLDIRQLDTIFRNQKPDSAISTFRYPRMGMQPN